MGNVLDLVVKAAGTVVPPPPPCHREGCGWVELVLVHVDGCDYSEVN